MSRHHGTGGDRPVDRSRDLYGQPSTSVPDGRASVRTIVLDGRGLLGLRLSSLGVWGVSWTTGGDHGRTSQPGTEVSTTVAASSVLPGPRIRRWTGTTWAPTTGWYLTHRRESETTGVSVAPEW